MHKGRLWGYAKLYKKQLIIGVLFLLIAVGADLAGPLIAKEMIDRYITDAKQNGVPWQPFTTLLAIFFGLAVVSALFRYAQYILLQSGANHIIKKMRNDVYEHINRLTIRYFDSLPAGKVVSRITNDTEAVRDLFVTVLSQFASSFLTIFGVYILLFILDWRMALIALCLLPPLIAFVWFYHKFAKRFNEKIRTRLSDMNGMLNESINGMTIIQAFGQEKKIAAEFEQMNKEHYDYQNKMLSLDAATTHNLIGLLRSFVFLAFIWYFGAQALDGVDTFSVGLLYAFVDYMTRLFNPFMQIVGQLNRLEKARVSATRVFELLEYDGTEVSNEHMPRYAGHVRFNDVSFAYKDDEYVLQNIDFEAQPGETVALVGHTGSGKSSIMNLLFRFYDVSKGRIEIDGRPIQDVPVQTIREHMGIVLQDPYLFTGTVASNISLGDPRISDERVKAAVEAVGGLKGISLDDPVVERGATLSSGQRQLISFARALAFDPAILILDEATSNIDSETEEMIQGAMDVLKKGRTTFMIAHRLSTIKNANLILVLDAGRIVERGTHEELLAKQGKYYQMYRLQSGIEQTN
ncbi:ABC transporter ATP-binding protein [Kurthia massiliensis]|uniref:ABC transporter ATP-binding protein n=1 Tax=Kurthia massiliensis TaxID=1033739 RepID=UPI00028866FE|nr:ABC transporter ATP-binding protein [Kurthia massiliensis]